MIIQLPWLSPPLTGNDRGHTRHNGAAKVTEAMRWTIRAHHHEPIPTPCRFTIHWRIPDRRRRDADNLAPTGKACLDALVREGLIPDDGWQYVRSTKQEIHAPEPGKPALMWLEVRAL